MGLLDFLKFKKGDERPRPYHYHFAHVYLPNILFQSFDETFTWLISGRGNEQLKVRWEMQKTIYQFQPSDYFEPDGLYRELISQPNGMPAILIRFPKAQNVGEAFCALILAFSDSHCRYFTVELAHGRKVILGQWSGGMHFNHGVLSDPNSDAVIEYIYSLYNERP